MADIQTPMTPADHVLAHCLTVLACSVIYDAKREAMHLDILRNALTKSDSGNPFVRRLSEAGRMLLATHDPDGRRDPGACLESRAAVYAWAEWRLGLAMEKEATQ